MKKQIVIILLLILMDRSFAVAAETSTVVLTASRPVNSLLGETLTYKISFLWFDKIARGEIHLEAGKKNGTYLATLTAKTLGITAFFTSNRIETYTTLMEEGPGGLLRPLLQTSDTQKTKRGKVTHRETSYTFDFSAHRVTYRKRINGVDEQGTVLPMDKNKPAYDFLTAFYNLRLKRLGAIEVGHDIKLAAFSRKGPEEIVISRLSASEQKKLNFSDKLLLCRVVMAPETFGTKSRDVYVGFDAQVRPQFAIVKNVIGLGDVRGLLIQSTEPKLKQ
ncbi:DUF3108 domain-containing protein [Geopsychrobacter electrodiphilus]|uniref:DUF3108 domain-containing protein n=1 Tax=Geopsychrobacter electrodiphilus TaxID=225196 RepID=UPI000369DB20|nr:DUF3108 domain-containing protein [Geopsychrobacter electrodiphilus]